MIIGIDFDNTIAGYDLVFDEIAVKQGLVANDWQGGKKGLRDYLRTLREGEKKWMRIQSQVYGKYMYRASLIPGVANFLLRCNLQKVTVFIVSHKTEFGNYDRENIPLRIEALKWMDQLDFLIPVKYIFEFE